MKLIQYLFSDPFVYLGFVFILIIITICILAIVVAIKKKEEKVPTIGMQKAQEFSEFLREMKEWENQITFKKDGH